MVKNTQLIDLPVWGGEYGNLVAIEEADTIPFPIERVYYIFDVPEGVRRGFHSHKDLEQVLICVHGSVKIQIEDDEACEVVTLDSASQGLYIGPMIWREMFDFEDGGVLLVLASKHYNVLDYERDHGAFLESAKEYFSQRG